MTAGVIAPAYDPWVVLCQSGDIEVNPGPVGERCAQCGSAIRAGAASLLCAGGCSRRCHKHIKCSGKSRAQQSMGSWTCTLCISPPVGSGDIIRVPAPIQTTLVGKLVGVGPSVSQLPSRGKCPVCSGSLRPSNDPLVCSGCGEECHKKCSNLKRKELEQWIASGSWRCPKCVAITRGSASANGNSAPPGSPLSGNQSGLGKRGKLGLLQWNADGIRVKMPEFSRFVLARKPDVCIVQESI